MQMAEKEAHEKFITIIVKGVRMDLQIKVTQRYYHMPLRMIGILANNKKDIVIYSSTVMNLKRSMLTKTMQCYFVKINLLGHTLGDYLGSF